VDPWTREDVHPKATMPACDSDGVFFNCFVLMEMFPNAKNCDRVTAMSSLPMLPRAGWAVGPSGVIGLRTDGDGGELPLEGQRKGLAARD
jgi:hypothetical protein